MTNMTKKLTGLFLGLMLGVVFMPNDTQAYSYVQAPYSYQYQNQQTIQEQLQYLNYLTQLVAQLQAQLQQMQQGGYYYQYQYQYQYPYNYNDGVVVVGRARSNDEDDDEPEVETESARSINDDNAELRGEVDMNDFRNGRVFFVYGEDESQVEDIEDDFDEYNDIDEDGDDLQKVLVDNDLDDDESYRYTARNLDEDEDYFFQICVEYEDEDNDDTIKCGGVEDFETGDNGSSNDDEPDVTTRNATDIDDDSAELRGTVDMNDFRNGVVFFVYGEDEDQIEDVENDYDSYNDVDEDGDDLQKHKVDSDLDAYSSYTLDVRGLDDNTDYFFQICVEYEDEDNDDVLVCGGVEDFETDN